MTYTREQILDMAERLEGRADLDCEHGYYTCSREMNEAAAMLRALADQMKD